MAEKDTHDVEVAHAFSASPEQVYDAWLDPALVQRWFGPGLGETLPVEVDARVGGRFRIVQMRDGQPVGHSGEYLILERPTHLAFTWATDDDDGRDEVHVYIEASRGGATARLVHTMDVQWKAYADRVHRSWASMLKAMDAALVE